MAGQVLAAALAGQHVAAVPWLHVPAATAPAALLATIYLSGGYGTINDLDKRKTTAAQSLGPVTELLARLVNKLSGGHRFATHNLVAPADVHCRGLAGGYWRHDWWGQVILGLFLAIGLVSGLAFVNWDKNKRRRHAEWVLVAAAVVLAVFMAVTGWGLSVVPTAVTVGAASHVVLDFFTDQGLHLLYPLSRRVFRFPVHFTTGQGFERKVLRPALIVALAWLLLPVAGVHFPVAHAVHYALAARP